MTFLRSAHTGRIKRVLSPGKGLTGIVFLIACLISGHTHADWQVDLVPGVTDISQQVFDIHRLMLYWCIGIGIIVFVVMFSSIFLHRKSRGHPAAHFHESTAIEIVWTIIPLIILILMAIPATRLLIRMDDTSDADITIKVTGSRWKWHYEYLDYQGNDTLKLAFESKLSTPVEQINRPLLAGGLFPQGSGKDQYNADGKYPEQGQHYMLEVDKPLVIPAGKKVRLLLTAEDVIHAWWVPDFAVKRDAIPGFINEVWFKVPEHKTGTYRGKCAELCGKDHAFMPIVVEAVPAEEFSRWLDTQQQEQRQASLAASESLEKTFTKEELMAEGEKEYMARCSACHQANGQGLPPTFPALAGSVVVQGPVTEHINIVKFGKNAMPAFANMLSEKVLAAILTYERNAWGNVPKDGQDIVQPHDVAE